ncbi:MAG: hypothetical protein AAF565_09890 [Pseudomonadota bacterium]
MKTPIAIIAIIAALGAGNSSRAQTSEATRDAIVENFFEADADADGVLTLGEFTTLIDLNAADGLGRAALVKRFNRYAMAFGRLDTNADRLLTVPEMQAAAAARRQ